MTPVLWHSRCLTAVFAGLFAHSVWAQPAQVPLTSRDGGGVKPNVMLTMDDSGSMKFQHMPEGTLYLDGWAISSPVNSISSSSVVFVPGDNQNISGSTSYEVVAGVPGSANWRQKFLRSPDTNTTYYNPEIRYMPWANPPATAGDAVGRMVNATPTAAILNPTSTSTTSYDLTKTFGTSSKATATWCFYSTSSGCKSQSDVFDPGLYYRLKKDASGKYLSPDVATNYTEYSINSAATTTYTKYPARTECAATACTQTEERQNFANWFTYYRTRNFLAIASIREAFASTPDEFRLGWGRINKGSTSIDGVSTAVIQQGVRDFTADQKKALFDWIVTLPASGSTPLLGAMQAVGTYYSRSDTKGPWSDFPGGTNATGTDKSCRRSYHILMTDGYWNDSKTTAGNSDNTDGLLITGTGRSYKYLKTNPYKDGTSNMLADYAMEYWKKDLRTDIANNVVPTADNPAFWQNMVNFTVGLGVRGSLQPDYLPGGIPNPKSDLPALTAGTKSWGTDKIDDLWHAALNSRGRYISAKDPAELAAAIRDSVGQAVKRELREAGVATSANTLQTNSRKYVPLYRTVEWTGDLQAYVLDADGQSGAMAWSASSKLPLPTDRQIYTWNPDTSTAVAFTATTLGTSNTAALATNTTTPTSTQADLVAFVRGDRSKEGDGMPFRKRNGVLGDFVNANPVLVKAESRVDYSKLSAGGAGFAAFQTGKASRTAVLYAGGNDGMLHAFKDTIGAIPADDGKEIFAYVPYTVLPNLKYLADKTYGTVSLPHRFYVDGSMVEHDAFVAPPSGGAAAWRSYLLTTLGAGGKGLFALDVTDPNALGAASVRWELNGNSDTDMGYITAPVEAGVLPSGEWVAVFGNGTYSTSGKSVLYVVNLSTGVARKLVLDSGTGGGLGGVHIVRDASGYISHLYAGDLKGKLWRLDYRASASSSFEMAGATALFNATRTSGSATLVQPITQAPMAYPHSKGGYMVVFGTGVLSTAADANSTEVQSIYGVWDKPLDTAVARPMGRSSMVAQSLSQVTITGTSFFQLSGTAIDWQSTKRGWVIDLDFNAGTRVIYPLQRLSDELVFVGAVAPAKNVSVCDAATGTGANLIIPVETGLNPSTPLQDTNSDGVINSSDVSIAGYATNADGVDALVRGKEVCSGSTCVTKVSIQDTTGSTSLSLSRANTSGATLTVKDRTWRRIINPPIK